MALFENFPYTNLHELNLDWLINEINNITQGQVLSVNGDTGHVILYQSENMQLPNVDSDVWQIIRTANGKTAGIHFNSTTGMATIVNGETLDQIYTHDHPPVYPVYSVNGQTGAVVTYPEQYVRLPDLTDEQMTNWTLFRHLNNVSHGIQFDDDGSMYVIDGMNRYKIYTQHTGDTPPYPVTSVNNSTGDITLYPEAAVEFPEVADVYTHDWSITRILNNLRMGIIFADDGNVSILNGSDEYPVYLEGLHEPSDFNDPSDAILEVTNEVPATDGKTWGITRTIEADNSLVGIVFKYNTIDSKYETFLKVGSTETKLLTAADIPPGSVVSVNGQTGTVVLTGEDLHVSTIDTDSIATAIGALEDDIAPLNTVPEQLAIVVDGDTSTQYIQAGDFVTVKDSTIPGITDGLYIAVNNVSANTPLSSVDLDDTNTGSGGLNTISEQLGFKEYTNKLSAYSGRMTITKQVYRMYDNGKREIYVAGTIAQSLTSAQVSIIVVDDATAAETAGTALIGTKAYSSFLSEISSVKYITVEHTDTIASGLSFATYLVFFV